METMTTYYGGKDTQALSCSNFEVLQRASTGRADVLGPAASLQSPQENASWLGGLSMYREPGDESFRNELGSSDIENALQECSTSLCMDLVLCHGATTGHLVGVERNVEFRHSSLLEGLAEDVAKMEPKNPGQRIFATSTSSFRTKDSKAVQDPYGAEWSILSDDSFQSISLVPGEESALISGVAIYGFPDHDSDVYKEVQKLSIIVKARLLVVTNPVSYDPELVDWHTYKIIGLLLVDIRKMEQLLGSGRIDFFTREGKVVFRLDPSSRNQKYASQFGDRGFVNGICRALGGHELQRGQRFEASIAGLHTMNFAGTFAAWNVLMAVRTILEATECGSPLGNDTLKYSRTVNDFITEYNENDLEMLANLMTLTDSEKWMLLRRTVTVGEELIELGQVGARNEEGYDHDKTGKLNRPKLKGRQKVQGCNVRGGRGIPVMSAAAFISYRLRGRRYRLTASEGKLKFSNRSDLVEDLNICRKVKAVEVGMDGVMVEKADTAHEEGFVDCQIVNALLAGQHGSRVARWIWALILFGIVAVDQESTKFSYLFGSDLNIDEESGYKIRVLMTSECLTRAVMYTDKKRMWVDVMDNLELREVKKEGEIMRISESVTALNEVDVETLWECSITSKLGVGKREN